MLLLERAVDEAAINGAVARMMMEEALADAASDKELAMLKRKAEKQRSALDEAGDQALHELSTAKWMLEEGLRKSKKGLSEEAAVA